ncbi:MAG: DUF1080 domain-containing protein [Cytophagales bacterium]|nr:DUF1080 domain-containing protein [Cytophagales bacterium]
MSDLYDLVAGKNALVRAVGEWNRSKIKVIDNRIEHWLNGQKVLEASRGTCHIWTLAST